MVVYLINILNKHYGLTADSTKIHAQFNSTSRTRDWEEGKWVAERGLTWVPSTGHAHQLSGAPTLVVAPMPPAKPWEGQK